MTWVECYKGIGEFRGGFVNEERGVAILYVQNENPTIICKASRGGLYGQKWARSLLPDDDLKRCDRKLSHEEAMLECRRLIDPVSGRTKQSE